MLLYLRKHGFTLIELSLVIALFLIILSFAVPYGLRFFTVERLNGISRDLLETLRLAQSHSFSQNIDSAYGVKVSQDSFVFFKGNSYSDRDVPYDQSFLVPNQIEVSGISEIVFSKLTGLPNQSGEIYLTNGSMTNVIKINSQGVISLELSVSLSNP
jgi:prepilin-type N-terminal cleavage/methylation domain-containing protein